MLLGKDEGVWIFVVFGELEAELHAYLVELRQVLDYYSLLKGELILLVCVLVPNPSEDEQLVRLLLVHYQVFAADDGDVVFAVRHDHADDFIGLSSHRLEKRNLDLGFLDLLETVHIIELDHIDAAHQKRIHRLDLRSPRSIQVLRHHIHSVIVFILPSVNVKRFLVSFEGHAITYSTSKHHS